MRRTVISLLLALSCLGVCLEASRAKDPLFKALKKVCGRDEAILLNEGLIESCRQLDTILKHKVDKAPLVPLLIRDILAENLSAVLIYLNTSWTQILTEFDGSLPCDGILRQLSAASKKYKMSFDDICDRIVADPDAVVAVLENYCARHNRTAFILQDMIQVLITHVSKTEGSQSDLKRYQQLLNAADPVTDRPVMDLNDLPSRKLPEDSSTVRLVIVSVVSSIMGAIILSIVVVAAYMQFLS